MHSASKTSFTNVKVLVSFVNIFPLPVVVVVDVEDVLLFLVVIRVPGAPVGLGECHVDGLSVDPHVVRAGGREGQVPYGSGAASSDNVVKPWNI